MHAGKCHFGSSAICMQPSTDPPQVNFKLAVGPPAIAGKGNLPTVVARQHIIIFTQVANHMYRLLWQQVAVRFHCYGNQ